MKKTMMITIVFCFVFVGICFGRTGFGNCFVRRIDIYDSKDVTFMTDTMPKDASAIRFGADHPMAKMWLAALIAAKAKQIPIYFYYDEDFDSEQGWRNLRKIEVKD